MQNMTDLKAASLLRVATQPSGIWNGERNHWK